MARRLFQARDPSVARRRGRQLEARQMRAPWRRRSCTTRGEQGFGLRLQGSLTHPSLLAHITVSDDRLGQRARVGNHQRLRVSLGRATT